ncbi:DUF192 domain-containing protein [Sphingomonas sp. CROZ-RG-20F-R02-07]|uniref:DUF192 domain-containing protein n=1 Tax=Sphingomonas sp. CROZ-RG-20F-R02-07 TaxID=2914832 RepID=UPI001F595238|nr:DUF192 domain-containing protein [Sphingomonas sp. CROZ-RG-20F-R02-07]
MRRAVAIAALAVAGCTAQDDGAATNRSAGAASAVRIPLTIRGAGGTHGFAVEPARTVAAQEQGLMYRTDLARDGGMLFWPYPPDGAQPREAFFWMKNTPTPLDILFIRADGTIARIADNAVPYSEAKIPSGEPIGAVLELVGGRTAELGIAEGDTVSWPGGPPPRSAVEGGRAAR